MAGMDYLLFLQNIRNATGSTLESFFIWYSDLTYLLCPLVLFFLYWSFKKEYGICGFMSLGITKNLNSFAKLCVCVYRPWILDSRIQPSAAAKMTASGYSFPSGHSSTAAGVFGILAWLFRKQKWLSILFLVLIPLTMFARNFLGVHTPQDVGMACLSGIIGAFSAVQILKWESEGKNRDLIILGVLAVLIPLILIFISNKSYPVHYIHGKLLVDPRKAMEGSWRDTGMILGFVLGWVVEKRFIRFSIPDSWGIRFIRYIPGIVLYFIVESGIQKLLIPGCGRFAGKFLSSFIVYFLFIAVYPLIFTAVEKFCRKEK